MKRIKLNTDIRFMTLVSSLDYAHKEYQKAYVNLIFSTFIDKEGYYNQPEDYAKLELNLINKFNEFMRLNEQMIKFREARAKK